MNTASQFFRGLLTALFTSLIAIGAVSIALTEGLVGAEQQSGRSASLEAPFPAITSSGTAAAPPATMPPLITQTPPTSVTCPVPEGWVDYSVKLGDSWSRLAASSGVLETHLRAANCGLGAALTPGDHLLIPPNQPPVRQATASPTPCGPPPNWVKWMVPPGETLSNISVVFGVTIEALQTANCLEDASIIHAGTDLWVPFQLPLTPDFFDPSATGTIEPAATSTAEVEPQPAESTVIPTIDPAGAPLPTAEATQSTSN